MRRPGVALLFILAALLLGGCRQSSGETGSVIDGAADVTLQLTVEPAPPSVGLARLDVVLLDSAGAPLDGATPVIVRGDMAHAGMRPVLATAIAQGDGRYRADFEWTMAGDWIVTVEATLPDGRVKAAVFDYTVGN